MPKEHPHAEATYRVVLQKDSTFGVEVNVPGCFPAMVTSFATEQSAEAWITGYKQRIAENAPYNMMRRKAPRD
jgi:NADH:ubiquinone oxidoreductase subunit B-like Fe-S oxidoreductase